MEKLSDVWDIRVLQEVTLRVAFENPVTKDEAMEIYTDIMGEYDIMDERDHEVLQVIKIYD